MLWSDYTSPLNRYTSIGGCGHYLPHPQLNSIVRWTLKEADKDEDNVISLEELREVSNPHTHTHMHSLSLSLSLSGTGVGWY